MIITREQYIAALKEAALYLSGHADELLPPLDQRTNVTLSIIFEPECLPVIEVKQEITSVQVTRMFLKQEGRK